MRSSDGQIIWGKSTPEIDGKECQPQRLVYLPQMDLILVGDYNNRRIIVVEAVSGDVVQTIELEEVELKEVGGINQLNVRGKQQLIVDHGFLPFKLSFYSVSQPLLSCQYFVYLVHKITPLSCSGVDLNG